MSRTRPTAWACAPSAGWSRSCTRPAVVGSSAVSCVGGDGEPLMPCGRCRQLLWENGGPDCLLLTPEGVLPMREVLPQAFGPADLAAAAERDQA